MVALAARRQRCPSLQVQDGRATIQVAAPEKSDLWAENPQNAKGVTA